jgi:hypothetical protein
MPMEYSDASRDTSDGGADGEANDAPASSAREGAGGLGGADRARTSGAGDRAADAGGQAGDVHDDAGGAHGPLIELPAQSPLFHAQHAARYDRQELIRAYEAEHACRLIVMIDDIFPDSVAFLEDLIYDASPGEDLHVLLDSPGGDGETAIRLVRSMQARCKELVVIVPDQAKSAATLITLGAHRIVMGPTSDLGPIDPQFRLRRDDSYDLVAAKDIVAAVDSAMAAVSAQPDTFPLHASLLADVNALMVQSARSALERTGDLLREALESHPGRSAADVTALQAQLRGPLIDDPRSHSAPFGVTSAAACGLPVEHCDPASRRWSMIWRLYAKYLMVRGPVYEGRSASQHVPMAGPRSA